MNTHLFMQNDSQNNTARRPATGGGKPDGRPPASGGRPPGSGDGLPRMRLPFERRKMDFMTWVYLHRAGLSMTIITFLVFGIALVSCHISMRSASVMTALMIDFDEPEKLNERPAPDLTQQLNAYDYSNVANRFSNEHAELNANLRDAAGTNVSQLYEQAGALGDRIRSNAQAYHDGLNQVDAMQGARDRASDTNNERRQDSRVDGTVTVSFSFENPVRTRGHLVVPAYMCQGGGTVVVNAELDRNGFVTSATVDRSRSTPDDCMHSTAVRAARNSRFNIDTSAPTRHRGTITYVFKPQ